MVLCSERTACNTKLDFSHIEDENYSNLSEMIFKSCQFLPCQRQYAPVIQYALLTKLKALCQKGVGKRAKSINIVDQLAHKHDITLCIAQARVCNYRSFELIDNDKP